MTTQHTPGPWHDPSDPNGPQWRCRKFIRRDRQAARTVMCGSPVVYECWAIHDDGREVYHGGECERHKGHLARSMRNGNGWTIEVRRVREAVRAAIAKAKGENK